MYMPRPFFWRSEWRLMRIYSSASWWVWKVPVVYLCLVVGGGMLDRLVVWMPAKVGIFLLYLWLVVYGGVTALFFFVRSHKLTASTPTLEGPIPSAFIYHDADIALGASQTSQTHTYKHKHSPSASWLEYTQRSDFSRTLEMMVRFLRCHTNGSQLCARWKMT